MTDGIHLYSFDGRRIGDVMPYYWQGVYHLYYLVNASGNVDISIEHAWSKDLVHWHQAETAVKREPGPDWQLDAGNVFTACFLTDSKGRHHLWYSSWNPENPNGREFIMHATSDDLFTWTKHVEDIIAPLPIYYSSSRYRDFRDPCVILGEDGMGYDMFCLANPVSAENANDLGSENWIFGRLWSDDLKHWQQLPPVVSPRGDECPDYHVIGGKHYLLAARKVYRAAARFGPYELIETGMDGPYPFAGKTAFDGRRWLWFGGWMGQAMLLPRELYLTGERLSMRVAAEVEQAFAVTLAQGTGESRVALPLPGLPCLVQLEVRGGDLERLTLGLKAQPPVQISRAAQTLLWNDDARRTLYQAGETMNVACYVGDEFVELFVDETTAFSFPAKQPTGVAQFKLHCEGAGVTWRVKRLGVPEKES